MNWLLHPITTYKKWRLHRAAQILRHAETDKHRQ